ncbi:hypothetical protein CH272_18490 [Rhodococcus sp. 05-340-1]|nr:hypothetical protein CH254_14310 [Rhodococcus sp. 06-412-2C]OZC96514.1 hypothetical protein CH279_14480 [Rhodococcus sp. 06-412-2B]OZD65458.1 hypothetical protein CH271_20300 [Rhodococcus sp. 05-340-2]OZD74675.1 hypothetical protein CH272_18490 [Rhodococcus sp. 05-340-1]OZD86745.1 hypothetical protein CH273_00535 [Rhodococcus sp. 05-339-2]
MRFMILGPLQIDAGDNTLTISAPKIEKLLLTLLIRANRAVRVDELISELWGQAPPRRARAALHVYVSQIRKLLAEHDVVGNGGTEVALLTRGTSYLLQINPDHIDVTAAQRHYAQGQALLADDPAGAFAEFSRAADMFRGPVADGVTDGGIVGGFAHGADELRLECLEAIAHGSLQIGRHRELVGQLAQWIEEYPLHESLREQLMIALYRSGRRAEALAEFQTARRVLREELGLEPRESMRQIQAAILDGGSQPTSRVA